MSKAGLQKLQNRVLPQSACDREARLPTSARGPPQLLQQGAVDLVVGLVCVVAEHPVMREPSDRSSEPPPRAMQPPLAAEVQPVTVRAIA